MIENSESIWTLKPFEMCQLNLISKIKHHPKEKPPKFGRTETREAPKWELQIKANGWSKPRAFTARKPKI